MKTVTHRLAGIVLAVAVISHAGDYFMAAGIVAGATAPDWMEMPKWSDGMRRSVIPHRTVTHWFLPWVAVFLYSMMHEGAHWALITGFTAGAMLHIAMDAMTPMGVPILNPFSRRSFK